MRPKKRPPGNSGKKGSCTVRIRRDYAEDPQRTGRGPGEAELPTRGWPGIPTMIIKATVSQSSTIAKKFWIGHLFGHFCAVVKFSDTYTFLVEIFITENHFVTHEIFFRNCEQKEDHKKLFSRFEVTVFDSWRGWWFYRRPIPALVVKSGKPAVVAAAAAAAGVAAAAAAGAAAVAAAAVSPSGFPDSPVRPEPPRL